MDRFHRVYGPAAHRKALLVKANGLRSWMRLACRLVMLGGLVSLTAGCAGLPAAAVHAPSVAIPASTDTVLGRIAAVSAPDPALSGFRLLPSGVFALDTRLELARRSQRSLDLQYFLIGNDATGREMLRALRDAGQRGVRVRLLLDDVYTAGQDDLLLGLAAHPNVEVRLFNPFPAGRGRLLTRFAASLPDFGRLNHRMHNKLFIADGVMAVTGGRNIADEYFTRHRLANFIDLDIFATGPVVSEMAILFDRYWNSPLVHPVDSIVRRSASTLQRQAAFERLTRPAQSKASDELPQADALGHGPLVRELDHGRLSLAWGQAEVFADPPGPVYDLASPSTELEKGPTGVRFNVLEHMRGSRAEVVVVSPYLIPGRRGMELLRDVRERGVEVSILTNSLASTDQPLVHIGYRRYRGDLLRLGVELYELSPLRARHASRKAWFGVSVGGLHTKAVVFDRNELFIGSMNFDPRSEHYNSEMGLFVHSPEVAREALRLVDYAKEHGAHRLRLSADGPIEWLPSADPQDEVHLDEPEAGWWLKALLDVLAPLAPEELL